MRLAPERTADAVLDTAGIPPRARERWAREMMRCTTREQIAITMQCHRMEAFLYARYGA